MLAYSIILFIVALLLLFIGISIRKGNINLIHDYHRNNISENEKTGYEKEFSDGILILCGTLFISGGLPLFGESRWLFWASLAVLGAGIITAIVKLILVQKKYNGKVM